MKSKHLPVYIVAASSCMTSAFGGTFLDGGTADVVGGIALIVGGMAGTLTATMLASVQGPDPLLWERITQTDESGKRAGA